MEHLPSLSSTSPINSTFDDSATQTSSPQKRKGLLNRTTGEADLRRNREAAARSARQEIRNNVREDWKWPYTPESKEEFVQKNRIKPGIEWRERDPDSSVPTSPISSPTSLNVYKYDNPDSFTEAIRARKHKRRKRLLAEMNWNDGLNNYIQRRDAWTAGLTLPSTATTSRAHIPPSGKTVLPSDLLNSKSYDPRSPEAINNPPSDIVELTPLPPPLLPPENLIRSSIIPLHYPSIYRGMVVQGTSPNIPINLAHVTRAMVAGWKDDGEWPPKPTVLEPSIGKRKKKKEVRASLRSQQDILACLDKREKATLASRGVGKMKRALGIGMRHKVLYYNRTNEIREVDESNGLNGNEVPIHVFNKIED